MTKDFNIFHAKHIIGGSHMEMKSLLPLNHTNTQAMASQIHGFPPNNQLSRGVWFIIFFFIFV